MCESHTYGKTGRETNTRDTTTPPQVLEWAKKLTEKGIADNLQNYMPLLEVYLKNPSQRAHFEKLHNGEEKFKYLNRIITEFHVNTIAAAYQQWNIVLAQESEAAMISSMSMASQTLLWALPPKA